MKRGASKRNPSVCILIFFVLGILAVFPRECHALTDGSKYLPGKEVITRIEILHLKQDGSRTIFGRSWLEIRGGHRILFLHGSPYEMGYQHGILLKDEIRSGVVPVFADPISMMPDYRGLPGFVKLLIRFYLDLVVYNPIERSQPHEYLSELKGIADGSGMDYETIFRANFMSDLYMKMLSAKVKMMNEVPGPVGECSSFAASGPSTYDGSLIFGRNTDYAGQGRYASRQVITLYQPPAGYRYVKVCTAGLIKCNTAMNEKGMVIGGHFMGYAGADPFGLSFTILENEIMRKAGTLGEAVDMVVSAKRGGSFGLVIADGKTGDAATVEAVRDVCEVRPMVDHVLCMTNYARTPSLRKEDLIARHNLAMRDVAGRYHRIDRLLKQHFGKITPSLAAEFMGDHIDAVVGRERGAGFTVGGVNTVESVVFAPRGGFFWVASGKEPVCMNEYTGFDFHALFTGSESRVSPAALPGYSWQSTAKKAGLKSYMDAFISHRENPGDGKTAAGHLEKALRDDPDEPSYVRMYASFLIREGNYGKAVSLLNKALALPQANNEIGMAYLLIAQAFDMQGKREAALSMYGKVTELRTIHGNDHFSGISDALLAKAVQGLHKPLKMKDIEEITAFSMQSGIE